MYEILMTAFVDFIRILIIRHLLGSLFETREINRKKEAFSYLVFYFLTTLAQLFSYIAGINMIANLVGLFIVTHVYTASLKKCFYLSVEIYAVCWVCNIIAVFTFEDYRLGDKVNGIFSLFTVILILLLVMIIEKIINIKNKTHLISGNWFFILLVPVISAAVLYILLSGFFGRRYLIIIASLALLIINVIIFYLYSALQQEYIQKRDKERLEQQVRYYENQIKVIEDSQNRMRSLRHDLKHHMTELYSRAKENEDDSVMEYIKSMRDYLESPLEFVDSGNKEIDSVLNYLLQKAKTKLKLVEIKIHIPENLSLSSFDLNMVLGNLLENAIEASEQTEKSSYL